MKRAVSLIFPLVLLFVIPAALAQDDGNGATPEIPTTHNLGSDLIAWSEMQTPEPVPAQTSPSTPNPTPAPEPRPETPAPKDQTKSSTPDQGGQPGQPGEAGTQTPGAQGQAPDNAQAEPAAQTFTGTISKEGDSYVLKVADTTSYKLDDQDKAKQYENQKVRVLGTVDKSTDMIHVQKIEPLT